LQGVHKKTRANLREELLILEQIEEENFLSLEEMHRKVHINTMLLDILEEEELYWVKRSHEKWLHEGDNNPEFFHKVANGRKKRENTIKSYTNGDEIIERGDDLLNHATSYYKELFGHGSSNGAMPFPWILSCGKKVKK
jgi:hypothetical protein